MKKVCESLRKNAKNITGFEERKNAAVNRKGTKITPSSNGMEQKSLLKIKITEKLETISIIQVNIEIQHIVFVI